MENAALMGKDSIFPGGRRDDAGPAPDRVPAAAAGGFTMPPRTTGREICSLRALRGLRQ